VYREDFAQNEVRRKFANGIDCILACREAIGPDVMLMIDCHWRFDEKIALELLRALEPAKLWWAECLVSERAEHHAALQRVRRFAEERGMLLVGGERQVGVLGFEPIIRRRLLDVVMPDIKYAGGYAAMREIAQHPYRPASNESLSDPRLG